MSTQELERLQRLRAARVGKPGYKANVEEIDRRIAELRKAPVVTTDVLNTGGEAA